MNAPRKIVFHAGESLPPHEVIPLAPGEIGPRSALQVEPSIDAAKAEINSILSSFKSPETTESILERQGFNVTRTSMDAEGNITTVQVPLEDFYKTPTDAERLLQINELAAQIERLKQQVNTQADMIESFRTTPATDTEAVAHWKGKWEQAEAKLAEWERIYRLACRDNSALMAHVKDMAIARDAWKQQYDTLKNDPKVPLIFQERIDKLQGDKIVLQSKVEMLEAKIADLEGLPMVKQIFQLQQQVNGLNNELSKCVSNEYVERLEGALKQEREFSAEKKQEIVALQKKIHDYGNTRQKLRCLAKQLMEHLP